MAIELVPPTQEFDSTRNLPSVNQEAAGRSLFEIIQALRQEASQHDPDSPGELTPLEIAQLALARAPGAVANLVALIRDEQNLADDIADVANVVRNQLVVQTNTDG